jgi:hypothetical protein
MIIQNKLQMLKMNNYKEYNFKSNLKDNIFF